MVVHGELQSAVSEEDTAMQFALALRDGREEEEARYEQYGRIDSVKLLRVILERLRRRKSLQDLAQDQAAQERFFQEREAKIIDYREWPDR